MHGILPYSFNFKKVPTLPAEQPAIINHDAKKQRDFLLLLRCHPCEGRDPSCALLRVKRGVRK